MMFWLLLIALLALLVGVGTWAWGTIFGRGEALPEIADHEAVTQANRAAVAAGDLAAIRLEVAPRGYRQDQVDALIADLFHQLNVSYPTHGRAEFEKRD